MDLDSAQVRLRRRTAWEAVDLGFVLGRHWFLKLWALWWLGAMPVFLAAALLLADSPLWVATIVWWFKPVYEPLMTLFIGRAMFGDEQSLREIRREWWRVSKHEWPTLLWRRFSSIRSFQLPVQVLEGLHGKDRSERLKMLGRNQSVPTWLTLVGVHLEFVIWLGLFTGVALLVPGELLPDIGLREVFEATGLFGWFLCVSMVLAMSVFAPFYVAAGFALYITRRSDLEGWDLELSFRRIARRLSTGLARAATLCLLAFPLLSALPGPAEAGSEREQAKQAITEILKAPEFGKYEEREVWRFKGEDSDETQAKSREVVSGLALARVLEFVGWTALVVGIALFIAWLGKHYRPRTANARAALAGHGPDYLFGMPVRAASLPKDVPGEVRRMLREGDTRAALALLYRATLVQLIQRHGLQIGDSATENECEQLVSGAAPADESGLFRRMTWGWVSAAYAHRPPAATEIETWAGDWERLYGA